MSQQDTTIVVNALWNLKKEFDRAHTNEEGSDESLSFRALLRDPDYRDEIIASSLSSRSERLKKAAKKAERLNIIGKIDIKDSADKFPENQKTYSDIAETSSNAADTKTSTKKSLVSALLIAAAFAIALLFFMFNSSSEVHVSGVINANQHWTNDKTYILDDFVFLKGNTVLKIDPGTVIKGEPGSALISTLDSRIEARGTKAQPIIFTSNKPEGERQSGDWGGVALLGNAPINSSFAHLEGVDDVIRLGQFGGSNPSNNCGYLEYVRIEFAGHEIGLGNELNGLTLAGCGGQTIIRNVQVHKGLDDGLEIFGGTVDLKHIVLSQNGDDGMDWDLGWTGLGQFIYIQQSASQGDNGIEADNNNEQPLAVPMSNPTLANITLLGSGKPNTFQTGIVFRKGTAGSIYNSIIEGFSKEAVDVRDKETRDNILNGNLSLKSVSFINNASPSFFLDEADTNDDFGLDESAAFRAMPNNLFSDKSVFKKSAYSESNPEITPIDSKLISSGISTLPEHEFWDATANYRGAVKPGSSASWISGWTAFPEH